MRENRFGAQRTGPLTIVGRLGVFALVLLGVAPALFAAERSERLEFSTMVAHWSEYGRPDYLDFISDAKPDLVQLGFYGAHFWSLADTPYGKGYPAHFPVQGYQACDEWFARMNREVHARGAKVVGHMNVKFLVGEPESKEGPRGIFKFYRDQWNVELLGPKPVEDPMSMLEIDGQGKPIINNAYKIGGMHEYWACLNNPNWRKVLKAWTRHGINQGVDGFVANYFYRHDCHCQYCVAGFKKYMGERFAPAELKQQFGIEDLATHQFPEIVGWHDPKESTPLRREMLRWSQIANKEAFDDVFVNFGRSIKPDLIAAQWNHLGDFNQISGDERCMLPGELWGKGEDYLWYSLGAAGCYTDLKNGYLGEGTLQARYIRGAFDNKPFTLGKYEQTRTRVAIAELAANGGSPMGFYARFEDPVARQEISRYYAFIRKYADARRASRPAGEFVLLYPRNEVHKGNLEAVAAFRKVGTQLLNDHMVFDVVPDDLPEKLAQDHRVKIDATAPSPLTGLIDKTLSHFDAPATVRVSLSRPAKGDDEITLHLVNYNRVEPEKPKSPGKGIADEKPIAVERVGCRVVVPGSRKVVSVEFATPEEAVSRAIAFEQKGSVVRFETPGFLVYGIARVKLVPGD